MHTGIGNEHRTALGDGNRQTHRNFTRFGINHTGNIGKAAIEVTGKAGDQAICMSLGHHDRGKDVTLLIDHALAITPQISFALQARIQEFRIFGIVF